MQDRLLDNISSALHGRYMYHNQPSIQLTDKFFNTTWTFTINREAFRGEILMAKKSYNGRGRIYLCLFSFK